MTKKTWAFISVGVLLAGAVAGLLLVKAEWATRVIALMSFLIAFAKTGYDLWDKERERRKKQEDSREKLTVRLVPLHNSISGTSVEAEIYNHGLHAINIKSVALFYKHQDGNTRKIDFTNFQHHESELLPSKGRTSFVDPTMNPGLWTPISRLEPKDVSLVIESYHGEVYRGGGEDVIRILTTPQH